MSSLGDIIQAFSVLDYLRAKYPESSIDWVAEDAFAPLVEAHPFVRNVLKINAKELKKGWKKFLLWRKFFQLLKNLRKKRYDILFDLQGNCKSGLITFLSRAKIKVGFGFHSVREKPNILSTHVRFNVSKKLNIREQYVELVRKFFQVQKEVCRASSGFVNLGSARQSKIDPNERDPLTPCKASEEERFDKVAASPNTKNLTERGITVQPCATLSVSPQEKDEIRKIFAHPCLQTPLRIMICPGSQWINKQIPIQTLLQFLEQIAARLNVSFLFSWGSELEKNTCENLQSHFSDKSLVLDKLPLTVWQNVMQEVDLVIAVDSSALHLCGMTKTSSFSVFGPTSPEIFKPIGPRHFAFQGRCPYGKQFDKMCPLLRTCPTGACMKNLDAKELAEAFFSWWDHHLRE